MAARSGKKCEVVVVKVVFKCASEPEHGNFLSGRLMASDVTSAY